MIGLAGVDGGVLWVVAGVFTLRSIVGAPPGFAWGVACIGAAMRWGTLGLGDLSTATRLFDATVLAGSPLVQTGMVAALGAAVVDEARRGGLRRPSWVERSAAILASVLVVALFIVPGPAADALTAGVWALAACGVLAATLLLQPFTSRLPGWLPALVAVAGLLVAEAVR